ncbi:hypothetical protein QYF61_012254 [Mycteria americana]|uniref:Uncharacterized protein n=1 Tax=Mycteria americana TaxID=33587 RepID=A0AAN7NM41_MYCAM|nr:hypothetical protein QYF61_012254 [Mycteria americana]
MLVISSEADLNFAAWQRTEASLLKSPKLFKTCTGKATGEKCSTCDNASITTVAKLDFKQRHLLRVTPCADFRDAKLEAGQFKLTSSSVAPPGLHLLRKPCQHLDLYFWLEMPEQHPGKGVSTPATTCATLLEQQSGGQAQPGAGGVGLVGHWFPVRPTSEKKDPGVLVDNKLENTQQHALAVEKDNPALGWLCRSRAVIIPLYSGLAKVKYLCTGEPQTSDRHTGAQSTIPRWLGAGADDAGEAERVGFVQPEEEKA